MSLPLAASHPRGESLARLEAWHGTQQGGHRISGQEDRAGTGPRPGFDATLQAATRGYRSGPPIGAR